jgi:hypothetical protein
MHTMPRARAFVLLAGAWVLSSCVPHPVGPARTLSTFQGKATTTAESALSEVQTVRLAVDTAERGRTFRPYLSVLVSEAEEGIAKVQGTFSSIQPPGTEADALAGELDELLTSALAHARDVRIAARRGGIDELRQAAEPLADDTAKLKAFVQSHP